MTGKSWSNLTGIFGIVAGAGAIGGGLLAHSRQPDFGIPQFFGMYSNIFSGVHMLIGVGIVLVIGGALSFKWPSVGGVIICVAAMVGMVYTYNRGQYRWTPLLWYWGVPWVFSWLAGIAAGYAAYKNVPQIDEKLHDARPNHTAG
jgi:hypothetical protein